MGFSALVGNYCGHAGVAVHPNGTFFLAFQHIIPTADRKSARNLEIFKVAPSGESKLLKRYVEGVDFPGPIGHCDLAILPSGTLVVAISAELSTNPDKDAVSGGYDLIPGVAPAWSAGGSSTSIIVDVEARRIAQLAQESANTALKFAGPISALQAKNDKLEQRVADLEALVKGLPTAQYVADVAWQKAGDRIVSEKGTIRDWITEVVVEIIQYARSATREQSRLRALIEDIAQHVA